MFVSRTNLGAWGVVLDFRIHKAMMIDSTNLGWMPMRQSGHGHLLVELIPKEDRARIEETHAAEGTAPWAFASDGSDDTGESDDVEDTE